MGEYRDWDLRRRTGRFEQAVVRRTGRPCYLIEISTFLPPTAGLLVVRVAAPDCRAELCSKSLLLIAALLVERLYDLPPIRGNF